MKEIKKCPLENHRQKYRTYISRQIFAIIPLLTPIINPFLGVRSLGITKDKLGHTVVQLVEALRYKSEGHGFDSRWFHCNFSLTQSFWSHCGPGVDSASNRTEYQEYLLGGKGGRCVGVRKLERVGLQLTEICNSENWKRCAWNWQKSVPQKTGKGVPEIDRNL